ncbi:hypothetical protein ACHAW6_002759 [Cyclotella cf. meneghiniana]
MSASIIFFFSAWLLLTRHGAAAFSPPPSLHAPTHRISSTSPLFASSSMFAIPSIFHPGDSRPVVLFDGKCNLCNAGVQLVLDLDRASSDARGNLRVAALQSRVGNMLLARLPPEKRDGVVRGGEYKSIVVAEADRTWIDSAACIRIGRELRGPLRYLAWLAWFIPRFVRDAIYRFLSSHRKRLFGESAECRLWDDRWDTRFVDDAMFGGRGANEDPFADPSLVAEQQQRDDEDEEGDIENAIPPSVGDSVRVVSSKPILHTHVPGYEKHGLCSVGLVGTVTRVLKQQSYPKNVAVRFEFEEDSNGGGATQFEAHFYPGQLRKV